MKNELMPGLCPKCGAAMDGYKEHSDLCGYHVRFCCGSWWYELFPLREGEECLHTQLAAAERRLETATGLLSELHNNHSWSFDYASYYAKVSAFLAEAEIEEEGK